MTERKSLSISVDMDTNKMQLKLRTIAKHTTALADELDAIDNAWQCDCGASDYTDLHSDSPVVERVCNKCYERYAVNLVDSSVTKGSE
ncbi:MAG: hypothetical protein ABTA16_03430 [Niallia sp.]